MNSKELIAALQKLTEGDYHYPVVIDVGGDWPECWLDIAHVGVQPGPGDILVLRAKEYRPSLDTVKGIKPDGEDIG